MCFYHDPGWCAEVYEDATGPCPGRSRCEECRCIIHPGEVRRSISMREYEECPECGGEGCPDGCHHGESFECDICEPCCRLLEVIEAVEIANGCRGDETQPGLGELREALRDQGEEYIDRALELHPTVANHLWRLLRAHDPAGGWSQADLEPVEVYGGEG